MREIRTLFIHSTATPEGRPHNAADIDRWHRQAGKAEIGYHKLFLLNGEIEDGRDTARAGAHVFGHNANSIGIAYVGGMDAQNRKPKDTRTPEQLRALENFVREFNCKNPRVHIAGHGEVATTACPSFDVQTWLKEIGIVNPPRR